MADESGLERYHPTFHSIPKMWYCSQEMNWYPTDTQRRFEDNKGHPKFGPDDIKYEFNSHGFRCEEFRLDARLRVMSIGCSYVFGVGLPSALTFGGALCSRLERALGLETVHWNLGMPGCSNDFMSRLLYLAFPPLSPDVVLVHFTHTSRRDYKAADGRPMFYHPSAVCRDRIESDVFSHFRALSSSADDEINTFRNYMGISAFLQRHRWLFSAPADDVLSSEGSSVVKMLGPYLNTERFCGLLRKHDTARDGLHPGPESHSDLADGYMKTLDSLEWLARLQEEALSRARND